ncbi:hypothetical protein [Staphylococcus sp. IVB6227]|uniref:hypothetical protein n=1 Tax=Staphylococcus sp. IVB6227 TaxID=2989768 RepID=UPI0021D0D632|nr:hypothetical protein [Staphylococcus sp. IVB6227]UXR77666.1 hypothetical protein MUA92_07220 [Staphylococcus sp. IVB6227]
MGNLSIEKRAHDLALLRIKIESYVKIQNNNDATIQLINDYAKYYYETKHELENVSNKIPELFS